jgi:hypothetical protein
METSIRIIDYQLKGCMDKGVLKITRKLSASNTTGLWRRESPLEVTLDTGGGRLG